VREVVVTPGEHHRRHPAAADPGARSAILFSATKGSGREELLETLGALLFPEAGDAEETAE
jgi:hypothetical protein